MPRTGNAAATPPCTRTWKASMAAVTTLSATSGYRRHTASAAAITRTRATSIAPHRAGVRCERGVAEHEDAEGDAAEGVGQIRAHDRTVERPSGGEHPAPVVDEAYRGRRIERSGKCLRRHDAFPASCGKHRAHDAQSLHDRHCAVARRVRPAVRLRRRGCVHETRGRRRLHPAQRQRDGGHPRAHAAHHPARRAGEGAGPADRAGDPAARPRRRAGAARRCSPTRSPTTRAAAPRSA